MNKKTEIIFNWLNEVFGSSTLHQHSDYPNSIFFKYDDIIIGEMDSKNKYFWIHQIDVWDYIRNMFSLTTEEVRNTVWDWLKSDGCKIKSLYDKVYVPMRMPDSLSRVFNDGRCLTNYNPNSINITEYVPLYSSAATFTLIKKILSDENH